MRKFQFAALIYMLIMAAFLHFEGQRVSEAPIYYSEKSREISVQFCHGMAFIALLGAGVMAFGLMTSKKEIKP